MSQGDLLHVVTADDITESRRRTGKALIWGSFAIMLVAFAYCALAQRGALGLDLENWRPALYGYLVWATCLCIAQVVLKGEQGKRSLFILPATLFVIAMVIFPLIMLICYLVLIFYFKSRGGYKAQEIGEGSGVGL